MRSTPPSVKMSSPFAAEHLGYALGALALSAAVVQVAIGCDFVVLLCAMLSAAIGLICFSWLGRGTLGGWAALLYVFGNVLVAVYAKTFLGQPLDSFLYDPTLSFFVLLVSVASLFAA